jgi:hypothetical protein
MVAIAVAAFLGIFLLKAPFPLIILSPGSSAGSASPRRRSCSAAAAMPARRVRRSSRAWST